MPSIVFFRRGLAPLFFYIVIGRFFCYDEEMKYPNFSEEKKLWKAGFKNIAGLDEAGRGPLAGPVVAAAVNLKFEIYNLKSVLNNKNFKILRGIKDSKKLSAKQREFFYNILTKHKDIEWGVGIVSEKIIDKINILEATKLAMKKAIFSLSCKVSDRTFYKKIGFLLIDGNFALRFTRGKKYIPEKSIIKGDEKVFSISAASIIAKVTSRRRGDTPAGESEETVKTTSGTGGGDLYLGLSPGCMGRKKFRGDFPDGCGARGSGNTRRVVGELYSDSSDCSTADFGQEGSDTAIGSSRDTGERGCDLC